MIITQRHGTVPPSTLHSQQAPLFRDASALSMTVLLGSTWQVGLLQGGAAPPPPPPGCDSRGSRESASCSQPWSSSCRTTANIKLSPEIPQTSRRLLVLPTMADRGVDLSALPKEVRDQLAELDLELSEGDITQKGYEKKRTKLLAPYIIHTPVAPPRQNDVQPPAPSSSSSHPAPPSSSSRYRERRSRRTHRGGGTRDDRYRSDIHTEAVQAALAKHKEEKMALPMPTKRRSTYVQSPMETRTPPDSSSGSEDETAVRRQSSVVASPPQVNPNLQSPDSWINRTVQGSSTSSSASSTLSHGEAKPQPQSQPQPQPQSQPQPQYKPQYQPLYQPQYQPQSQQHEHPHAASVADMLAHSRIGPSENSAPPPDVTAVAPPSRGARVDLPSNAVVRGMSRGQSRSSMMETADGVPVSSRVSTKIQQLLNTLKRPKRPPLSEFFTDDTEEIVEVPQPDPNTPRPEGRQIIPVKGEPLGVVSNWPPALQAALARWGATQGKSPALTALDITGKPLYTLTYEFFFGTAKTYPCNSPLPAPPSYKASKEGTVVGVAVSKVAMLTHCQALTQACNYCEGETLVNVLDFKKDMGLWHGVLSVIPVNSNGVPIGEIPFVRSGLLGFIGPHQYLAEALHWRAQTDPDHVLFVLLNAKGVAVSTATCVQLHKRAEKIAAALMEKGSINTGENVVLLYPPGIDLIAAFYGCLYAGCVPVNVRPPHPQNLAATLPTVRMIIDVSKAACILTTQHLMRTLRSKEAAASVNIKTWPTIIDTDDLPRRRPPQIYKPPTAEMIAYLDFSVSTTGMLTGVKISHAAVSALCRSIKLQCELYSSRQIAICLDPYCGLGFVLWCLSSVYSGHQSILIPPFELESCLSLWLSTLSQYRVRDTFCSYSVMELCTKGLGTQTELLKARGVNLSCVRSCVVIAEERPRLVLTHSFSKLFKDVGLSPRAVSTAFGSRVNLAICLQGTTGPDPCTVYVDMKSLRHDRVRLVERGAPQSLPLMESGKILPGVRVIIVNPETRGPLGDSHLGEIWVNSPHSASGYYTIYGEESLQANHFNTKLSFGDPQTLWARTGYLGFVKRTELLDASGDRHDALFVVGSLDETLELRGLRYHPIDIETSVSRAHRSIAESAVFTWTNLLVVVSELCGSEQDALDLVPLITNVVLEEHHLIVGVVVIVDPGVIPINSRGEKQRMHLRDSFLADQLDPIYVAYNM
ncbi:Disco-interacting protein 2 -like protein B-A [Collichthys lucidus]|uniref:Disco-interacting protein 2-like protein B-A n=1 Tax=Collichthys lucidus TaxID=240159 RepID=A0A4U5UAQ8_COLLU|nr:Disco-interacting protein 2 -like protein B-A [Collichthys lucidus]